MTAASSQGVVHSQHSTFVMFVQTSSSNGDEGALWGLHRSRPGALSVPDSSPGPFDR